VARQEEEAAWTKLATKEKQQTQKKKKQQIQKGKA
jgi:hypothetical protein